MKKAKIDLYTNYLLSTFEPATTTRLWHYDHVSGSNVRGINLLNTLYHVAVASVPVAFELIKKPLQYCDMQTRQIKRMSEVTKNELMRQMIHDCIQNELKFRYVLMDSWFSSQENFAFITQRGKHFIAALKNNRLVALSEQGHVRGYLKGYDKEVLVVGQVFTHKDGCMATLHLVCSDLASEYSVITTTYKKRWAVQVFHKSLKSNASLAKSPTRTARTQSNHVFMTICAACKLAILSIQNCPNSFALCRKVNQRCAQRL